MPNNADTLLERRFVQKLQRLSLFSRRSITSGMSGEHRSARSGRSLEFADYRNYVWGDDFRTIDWNIYARLEKLLVKVTEAQEAITLHLLVDASRSMDWGEPNKLLYSKRLVAALGYVALAHFDWISVAAFGPNLRERFPAARGRGQMLPLLRFLDELKPTRQTNLRESLRNYTPYLQQANARGLVVVISDLLSPAGYEEGLRHISSSRSQTILLHVLDPMEAHPQLAGDLQLIDSESGEPLDITITPALIEMYTERFKNWIEEITAFCSRRGIYYLQMTTDLPVENLVLSYLRRRQILR